MNERIKELYEQAHDVEKVWLLPESIREVGREGEVKTFNPEKFAELLVRECIYIVENTSDRYRKEYFANKIKQHFGVEE